MKFRRKDHPIVDIRKAARREPFQVGIEDHQHQQAKHKGWKGSANNTKYTGSLVDDPILMDRGLHSQPNTNQDHRSDCPNRQIKSIGEAILNQVSHWLRCNTRVTKITKENPTFTNSRLRICHPSEPLPILNIEWLIQTILFDYPFYGPIVFRNITNI